jgi:hypothetical protein
MANRAIFLLVDWPAAVLAFVMEPDEHEQLTWLIFIQRFAYPQAHEVHVLGRRPLLCRHAQRTAGRVG